MPRPCNLGENQNDSTMFQKSLRRLTTPVTFSHWSADLAIAIPRILCGLLLTLDFGSSKFGMPWTDPQQGLALFQVAAWFPEDVAAFGPPFSWAPGLFAWIGAASEAIGGLLLVFGFQTRISSFFIACTMLVAIFFQKWGASTWEMLPAMGFLWVSIYSMVLGSGRFGLDYLLSKRVAFFRLSPKIATGLVLVLGLSLSSCSSNQSVVSIPAQNEFVLGEISKKNFTVKLTNLTDKDIRVQAIDIRTGEPTQGFGLAPKGNATVNVSRHEKVLLKNATNEEVRVRAVLNKGVQGMRYQAVGKEGTQ